MKPAHQWVPGAAFAVGIVLILLSMLGLSLGWHRSSVVFVIGVVSAFAGALTDMAIYRSRWVEKALILMMATGFLAWVLMRHWHPA